MSEVESLERAAHPISPLRQLKDVLKVSKIQSHFHFHFHMCDMCCT